MAIIGGIFGARYGGVASGQKGCGARVEQSQGQMWHASLKGGEGGGCGENLRTSSNLCTVATQIPNQAGCPGSLASRLARQE